MKPLLLTVVFSSLVMAAMPKLQFTKSFPGSTPPFCSVEVAKNGALLYKESLSEEPLRAQMREADAAALFAMAEKLDYFKMPLESGLKVANTGKKTFRYEDENGAATEAVFNYSLNETAKQLLERFEQIAATERAYIDLDRTIHFDKLGVNDSLAQVEALWLHKELIAPEQFLPLFARIASHDSFMHLVRDRAARLKDEFSAPPAADGQK
jgi:hypothetical protein